jgi:transcriptional regulator with XRE-family HTH domain
MDLNMLKDVLKTARTNLNLKQSDVAEKVGVTTQTYLKWENGHSEPKASQAGKLAKALNITEKEICQGELIAGTMDPLEFVRRVGILMSHVPQTEMLIGMHEYISDDEGFIEMLKKVSDYPYGLLEAEEKENKISNAKMLLKVVGMDEVIGESQDSKKAREYALNVLNKHK